MEIKHVSGELSDQAEILDRWYRSIQEKDFDTFFYCLHDSAVIWLCERKIISKNPEDSILARLEFDDISIWCHLRSRQRNIYTLPHSDISWFDESLFAPRFQNANTFQSANGVLVQTEVPNNQNPWRIVQFFLGKPIPKTAVDRIVK